jgi:hypothetical protein
MIDDIAHYAVESILNLRVGVRDKLCRGVLQQSRQVVFNLSRNCPLACKLSAVFVCFLRLD